MLVLYVVILLLVLVPPFVGYCRESAKNSKREKELRETVGPRRACRSCSYCKKRLYKPFYHSYTLAVWEPSYCRKFKMKLPPGSLDLRCMAKNPDKAVRDKLK